MADPDAPWHAHVYYAPEQRAAAATLRESLASRTDILFVGRMMDEGVGPHPMPQYEIHFRARSVPAIIALLEESGLRALVHPLTDDDLADHIDLARWIGAPVELDVTALDPLGHNQGIARFGLSDF
ncbi:MAG TPA: DOPA 4,5-dioxygenase family protein [Allosphingosinicella sp.]|nr:DOPA 4,5-dioxygenase family protein [Allosphingosinicella sp.]